MIIDRARLEEWRKRKEAEQVKKWYVEKILHAVIFSTAAFHFYFSKKKKMIGKILNFLFSSKIVNFLRVTRRTIMFMLRKIPHSVV